MPKCFRHFKALMRKNFILWWRTPGCSLFEILAPILLMAVLWVIRVQVPTTNVNKEGMFSKKYFTYPGLTWNSTDWKLDNGYLNGKLRPFAGWADKKDNHYDDPYLYDAGYDYYGPQIWAPGHCIKQFDFNSPKQASPYIAIIGT